MHIFPSNSNHNQFPSIYVLSHQQLPYATATPSHDSMCKLSHGPNHCLEGVSIFRLANLMLQLLGLMMKSEKPHWFWNRTNNTNRKQLLISQKYSMFRSYFSNLVSCYNVCIEIYTNIIILILRFMVIKTHLARQQLYCAVFARWGHPQVHNRGQFKVEKLKIWKGAPVKEHIQKDSSLISIG